jgi:MFS family permease
MAVQLSVRDIEKKPKLTSVEKKTLLASWAGFSLDSYSTIIYSLVITSVMAAFHLSPSSAGLIGTVTLVASALGGVFFGIISDYWGKKNVMVLSILLFAVFSAMSAIAQNYGELLVSRALVGFGFAGEYTASMMMVTEVWPSNRRTVASALTQSGWAVGFFFGTLVTLLLLPSFGYRAVFWAGALPALFVLYIRFGLPESKVWEETRKKQKQSKEPKTFSFAQLWTPILLPTTLITMAIATFNQFVYWGINSWLPAYLVSPRTKGGAGLGFVHGLSWLLVFNAGSFLGYICFGWMADRIGRKKALAVYLIATIVLLTVFVLWIRAEWLSYVIAPIIGFFGTGYISAFGAMFAELFPTTARATGQGFVYNFGRGVSGLVPWIQGLLIGSFGFASAMSIPIGAAILLLVCVTIVRNTQGKELANFAQDIVAE